MLPLHIDLTQVSILLAIALRLSVIVFMLPMFSGTSVPSAVKACTVIALTGVFYFPLKDHVSPLPQSPELLAAVVGSEIIFSMVFSMSVLLIFTTFEMAGELISFEMGFGFAHVADPQSGGQASLFSFLLHLFATMLFFTINGHHILFRCIFESFQTVPIGSFLLNESVFNRMIALSTQIFIIAVKMSAPVMVVLLLTQFGMGLMAKFSPQINILTTSFPLTIAIGLIFMSFSIAAWGGAMEIHFKNMFHFLNNLVK